MDKKETVKKILGYKNIMRIKKAAAVKKWFSAKVNHMEGAFECNKEYIADIKCIEIEGKNVFFGYYDLKQLNSDGTKALVHIVKKQANPAIDSATLAWVDMNDLSFHEFATTRAWSWQQGARLRWHPCEPDKVLYNDYDNKEYVTRVFDLRNKKVTDTISVPLYDIDCNGQFGLSLNFARLQRLRPGYGYSATEDSTSGKSVPENEGIYLWEKKTGMVKKIVDLYELAKKSKAQDKAEHYLNHISISPGGKKFLFFHLWSNGLGSRWGMALYVADIDGSNLRCIDDTEVVSHYSWLDDNTILTTVLGNGNIGHPQYIEYQLENSSKKIIDSPKLNRDGHPTYISKGKKFLSDTYPQRNCMQYVFISESDGTKYTELLKIFANPFLLDEHRCDLHPRVDEKKKLVTIDTTYTGVRSVLVLKLNG